MIKRNFMEIETIVEENVYSFSITSRDFRLIINTDKSCR